MRRPRSDCGLKNTVAQDHRLSAGFVLGYHGCNKQTAQKLIQKKPFKPSKNPYDWLGHGVYFWESNPDRALSFIKEAQRRRGKSDRDVAVVGAAIDLGYCLDLLSEHNIGLIKQAYISLREIFNAAGKEMPVNTGKTDLFLRRLDCAVINYLHTSRGEEGQPEFQTVRGLFTEGKEIFKGSGFQRKTHVQICVRTKENIKGVFLVR